MKGSGAAESERDVGPANALGPTGSAAASAEPAEIWVFPVQTVSQSESGFERVLQSVAIVFVWPINVAPGGPPWCADLCYSILKKGV